AALSEHLAGRSIPHDRRARRGGVPRVRRLPRSPPAHPSAQLLHGADGGRGRLRRRNGHPRGRPVRGPHAHHPRHRDRARAGAPAGGIVPGGADGDFLHRGPGAGRRVHGHPADGGPTQGVAAGVDQGAHRAAPAGPRVPRGAGAGRRVRRL
ncbi:MAG: hypothetical protein AVDCRST_MAG89-732, partial [uncultured Gemmatimonadetes bacterium]